MSLARNTSEGAAVPAGRRAWWALAQETEYGLAVPDGGRRQLAVAWLALALASLIGAGIFSVLLVAARTPYLQHLFPVEDFFRVALVVHVDLSVLVWFSALAGVLWSLNSSARWLALGWAALAVAALGTLIMSVAPFLGSAMPVTSNYIPVLDDARFLTGLGIFGAGVALLTLRSLAAVPPVGTRPDGAASLRFGLNAAAVSAAVAALAFGWSWLAVPAHLPSRAFYDVAFWGGGHVIQFTFTLLMLVAWLWLASACGARVPLTPRVALLMFAIALASVFLIPVIYLAYEVTSVEHRRLMTWLMQSGGGLAILPVGLAVVIGLARARAAPDEAKPLRAALISSLVLFSAGGAIGFTIEGANVRIPAHYHGSIVGVTLALMGLVYLLLPRLGLGSPSARLATLQPYLYGFGQLLHVAGLMWSGGYGVQRKVAGAGQVLRTTEEIVGMGIMGLGGLIAVVGGLLFVIVVAQAMWRGRGGSR